MKKIVIFGAGNLAKLAHFYFTHDSDRSVAAFTVDRAYVQQPVFQGLPLVAFTDLERHFPPSDYDMFVALGIQKVNTLRSARVAEAEAKGYTLASYVCSKADVWPDLKIHPNTMLMEHTIVYPGVEIGRGTIVVGPSVIGNFSKVGEYCFIAAARVGESVTLGDHSFVGMGATISSFMTIGKSNVIGAGALILKDTKDFEVYKGHASTPSEVPSHQLRLATGCFPPSQD